MRSNMCGEIDNILKWGIRIKASDELNRIILENRKTNSGLLKNLKNINSSMQCEDIEENLNGVNFTKNELLILKKLESKESIIENIEQIKCENNSINDDLKNIKECVDDNNVKDDKSDHHQLSSLYLQLTHIKWFYSIIPINIYEKEVKYLHDILIACIIILPKNIVKRDPVLEARCQLLRAKQENLKYKKMTKNIDSTRRTLPEDTIAYQVKSINKQLIAVLQFIFSVAAGFAFGFIGIELIIGNLDFGFRLLLGIICALTIALAEMYFLAKKLNEMDKFTTDDDQDIVKKTN